MPDTGEDHLLVSCRTRQDVGISPIGFESLAAVINEVWLAGECPLDGPVWSEIKKLVARGQISGSLWNETTGNYYSRMSVPFKVNHLDAPAHLIVAELLECPRKPVCPERPSQSVEGGEEISREDRALGTTVGSEKQGRTPGRERATRKTREYPAPA
jgi:hypothetical protein